MRKKPPFLAGLKALFRTEGGVAAVEFALIFPFMLLLYVGSVEGSSAIILDRKVQSTAGAVGDLVARADKILSANQLRDFFSAASGIVAPYSTTGMVQVVTAVAVDEFGATEVVWTRKYESGDYFTTSHHAVGDAYPLPKEMIDISRGRMVIASEVSHTYTPLTSVVFKVPINLYRSSFYLPRFGDDITLVE